MNKISPADISDPKEAIARASALSLEPEATGFCTGTFIPTGMLAAGKMRSAAILGGCGGFPGRVRVQTSTVTRQIVDNHQRPIGQLQWLDDLPQRFSGPGNTPGDVTGVRWGSGGLIANGLFITAGHRFDNTGGHSHGAYK